MTHLTLGKIQASIFYLKRLHDNRPHKDKLVAIAALEQAEKIAKGDLVVTESDIIADILRTCDVPFSSPTACKDALLKTLRMCEKALGLFQPQPPREDLK